MRTQVRGRARRFAPDAELATLRIVQEALNNVEAHAQAQQPVVALTFGTRELSVEVKDNGIGFDVAVVTQAKQPHLGFISIRERVSCLDGALQLRSSPGEGTCVRFQLILLREETLWSLSA